MWLHGLSDIIHVFDTVFYATLPDIYCHAMWLHGLSDITHVFDTVLYATLPDALLIVMHSLSLTVTCYTATWVYDIINHHALDTL